MRKPDTIRQLTDDHRYQLLVDAITDYAIYMLDPDGFVVSWNSGARKLKLYAAQEIIGQHFSRFFPEEDRLASKPNQALATAQKAGRSESEGWLVRKDGSRFWAVTVIEAIKGDSGELIGFAKITRDLTERRAAQQAVYESERRFRLLIQNVTDYAIYMLDPSGIVVNWNAGAERLKGYTSDEIVGQHFSRFYTKEDRTAGLPHLALTTAMRAGRFEAESWRVRKDGGRFWASVVIDPIRDNDGTLLGFAKITRDITERRYAQEALKESERQFRLLVSGVTDYAIYMLDLNGIVISWNAGAERIKGYSADEIIGQHVSKFYNEADRLAGVPARALYTAISQGHFEAEGWRVRKDGAHFWAHVVIDPIRDEKGMLISFAKITRDITERHETEKALELAQAQLAHAKKMEALGELTGGVAHDFNNLMTIISGAAQRLKSVVGDNPNGKRAIAAIEIAVTRGANVTSQMLSFSGRRELNRTRINLKERLQAVAAFLSNSLPPSIQLVLDIRDDVWPVEVDSGELDLAMLNLTLNARDAIAQEGVIMVTAENVVLTPDRKPGLEGEFIAITLTDNGAGIPADVLPKVFDPFFTTKDTGKGTGLGLSQVYGFVTQSGGGVKIKSEIGRGTYVTLYLPKSQHSEQGEVEAEHIEAEHFSSYRVLVVEDNPEVAEVASTFIQQLGFKVTIARNAEAALECLTSRQAFDLMFSDLVMPGAMDGAALAVEVRHRYPDMPILLTTGFSKAADALKESFPLLRKPYDIGELSRAIAKLNLQERERQKQPNLVTFPELQRMRASKPSGKKPE